MSSDTSSDDDSLSYKPRAIIIDTAPELLAYDPPFEMMNWFITKKGNISYGKLQWYIFQGSRYSSLLFVSPQAPLSNKNQNQNENQNQKPASRFYFHIGEDNLDLISKSAKPECLIFTKSQSVIKCLYYQYFNAKSTYQTIKQMLINQIPIDIINTIANCLYKNEIYMDAELPMIICASLLVSMNIDDDNDDDGQEDLDYDENKCITYADFAVSDQHGGLIACVPCAMVKPRGQNPVYSMQNRGDGISLMALHQHLQSEDHIESIRQCDKVDFDWLASRVFHNDMDDDYEAMRKYNDVFDNDDVY
jgi:hypothetical protein